MALTDEQSAILNKFAEEYRHANLEARKAIAANALKAVKPDNISEGDSLRLTSVSFHPRICIHVLALPSNNMLRK